MMDSRTRPKAMGNRERRRGNEWAEEGKREKGEERKNDDERENLELGSTGSRYGENTRKIRSPAMNPAHQCTPTTAISGVCTPDSSLEVGMGGVRGVSCAHPAKLQRPSSAARVTQRDGQAQQLNFARLFSFSSSSSSSRSLRCP